MTLAWRGSDSFDSNVWSCNMGSLCLLKPSSGAIDFYDLMALWLAIATSTFVLAQGIREDGFSRHMLAVGPSLCCCNPEHRLKLECMKTEGHLDKKNAFRTSGNLLISNGIRWCHPRWKCSQRPQGPSVESLAWWAAGAGEMPSKCSDATNGEERLWNMKTQHILGIALFCSVLMSEYEAIFLQITCL